MTEEEINLKEMPTEEILELMHEDLYDGLAEEIVEEVNELLSRDMGPYDVLTKGLVAGMDAVPRVRSAPALSAWCHTDFLQWLFGLIGLTPRGGI